MFTKKHVNVNRADNIKVRADIAEIDGRQGTLKSSSYKGQQTLHKGYQYEGKIKYTDMINKELTIV